MVQYARLALLDSIDAPAACFPCVIGSPKPFARGVGLPSEYVGAEGISLLLTPPHPHHKAPVCHKCSAMTPDAYVLISSSISAESKRHVLNLSYPITDGVITNWLYLQTNLHLQGGV